MENLRKRAEEFLQLQNSELSEKMDDVKKLMHELQVYQIELEMQNHEIQENAEKLRNAERKFFTLFNFAPIAYFLFDYKGVIEECNLKALELLNHSKEQIMNKPMVSYIAEGRKDEFYSFLDETIRSKHLQSAEFSIFNRERDIIAIEFNAIQIYNDNILAAAIDITEKRKKDLQLTSALIKAELSDKLKTDFLNTISHEIRTPLNAIVGFSDLMCNTNISEEKRKLFSTRIKNGSNQLLKIIEDILIVSKLTNQDVIRQDTNFSTNNFLKETKTNNDFKNKYKNYSIPLILNLLNTDEIIYSDREKLRSIVDRLIENAYKFTNEGVIEIGCYKKKSIIVFYVKDTGIGISEETQEKLFKPFVQIENQGLLQSGLGLGLVIAKGYVELLSGNIWYEPNNLGGSVFYVALPLEITDLQFEEEIINKSIPLDINKKTILIAEDEHLNYELLSELFSDFDVNIIHAENGKMAVELFKIHKIDIILMDLKMPVMDGIAAARIIRKINPKLKIIALTAHTNTKNDNEVNELFDALIFKPINISATLNTLNNLLNG